MLKDLRTVATRSAGTLLQDLVGAGALGILLFAGLQLPSVF